MPNVSNYREQGGSRDVVGGSLDIVSGGDLDIESGASFKIAGTTVAASAAELDLTNGLTATTAELNLVADASAQGGAGFRVLKHTIAVFTNVETDILTLPAGAIVLDIILNITDASSEGGTINIGTQGTSNDPNGFFASVPTNALITLSARSPVTMTTGGTETYISAIYEGALMFAGVIGLVGTNAADDFGIVHTRPAYFANADPISYTLSETLTSFAATITVIYIDIS